MEEHRGRTYFQRLDNVGRPQGGKRFSAPAPHLNLYNNSGAVAKGDVDADGSCPLENAGPTTVFVSNLQPHVTDEYIRATFGHFGPLSRAAVHYDCGGQALGSAQVTFVHGHNAVVARKQLNGKNVDGLPIVITLVGCTTVGSQPSAPSMAGPGSVSDVYQRPSSSVSKPPAPAPPPPAAVGRRVHAVSAPVRVDRSRHSSIAASTSPPPAHHCDMHADERECQLANEKLAKLQLALG